MSSGGGGVSLHTCHCHKGYIQHLNRFKKMIGETTDVEFLWRHRPRASHFCCPSQNWIILETNCVRVLRFLSERKRLVRQMLETPNMLTTTLPVEIVSTIVGFMNIKQIRVELVKIFFQCKPTGVFYEKGRNDRKYNETRKEWKHVGRNRKQKRFVAPFYR